MKLRIGAFDYQLNYVEEELISQGENGDKYKLFGQIDYSELKIDVWKGAHAQTIPATILHEVVHGILRNAGYQDHSEELVEAVTLGLISFARDNPGVLSIKFK
jgi:hypothetical protein